MLYNILSDVIMQKVKVLIMDFILGIVPPEEEDKASFLFLFRQRNLLVKKLEKEYGAGFDGPHFRLDTDKLYIGKYGWLFLLTLPGIRKQSRC